MIVFRDLSLKWKQALLIIAITTGTLMLGLGGVVAIGDVMFRESLRQTLRTRAAVIGQASAAALEFGDAQGAREVMEALKADPRMLAGSLYTKSGARFASFRRVDDLTAALPAVWTDTVPANEPHASLVWAPVLAGGVPVGLICLKSDHGNIAAFRAKLLRRGAGISLVLLLVAAGAAFGLQRLISRPVADLLTAIKTVTEKNDFSRRAVKQGNDELGQLADAFNGMLAQIERRDAELREANVHLEQRVAERTQKLQTEVAERQRSEQTVLESQQFFQSALDALSAHIAILDKTGVIVAVNAAWHRFALENGPVTGSVGPGTNYLAICERSVGDYGEEAVGVARGIRSVLAGEIQEFLLEYPCHSPDEQRWFMARITRFGGENPQHVVIAHINITERRKAEVRLRTALHEVESQQFALNAACIVDITDPAGHITYVNDRFCAITQYAREELLGQDHRILNSGFHPKEFFKTVWETVGRGEVWRGRVCNRAKDGSHFWVDSTVVPFKNEAGALTQFVVIRADVTEQVRAEERLTRAQAFLHSVVENLPVGIFLKNAGDRQIVLWNKANEEIHGWHAAELLGKCDHDLFPQAVADGFAAKDTEALGQRGIVEIAAEAVPTRHRGVRVLYTRKVPILGPDGVPTHLLGISEDITERQQAQADLLKAQQDLLAVSRQAGMAEVATSVLHNVGNVLNSVNVAASLLGDRVRKNKTASFGKVAALIREQSADLPGFFASDPRARQLPAYLEQFGHHLVAEQQAMLEDIEHLRKNVDHIKDIVAMQQSFANVAGVTQRVTPASLIDDTLQMNAGSLDRHAIEVVKEIGEVPPIDVDKHKVLQILINFLRNAKHACDDTGRTDKRIVLRVEQRDDQVVFSVIDNGIGITAENLKRIFNHGFTTKKDGHGFGLHSAANAATEMGGAVSVHSAGPGLGATFTLALPMGAPAPAVVPS